MKEFDPKFDLSGNGLNEEQREAVMFEGTGPLLVLAGPGSGKTFVITKRIQFLLEKMAVSPEKILVLTFTRDAALSMQQRFLSTNQDSKTVNFGTFHSIFYHIVKSSTPITDRQILTETDKRKILLPIMGNLLPSLPGYRRNNLCSELLQAIGYYKNTKTMEQAIRFLPSELQNCFMELYQAYEKKRREEGRMDFDDMLEDCRRMLSENASLRAYWQERFSHILIDEFQDINPAQYEVIRLLSAPPYNLFAVGDDDQSIYGFRGSDPGCMMRFAKEYQAKQIRLQVNYRSTPQIIQHAQKVIAENHNRFPKSQRSWRETGAEEKVVIQKFLGSQEQNDFILQQCSDGGDAAVLFRTNRLMQRFALEMRRRGIPYEMKEKTQNPYDHEVVQDVMAYLRLAAGEEDHALLCRILNRPSRFVSRELMADRRNLSELKEFCQAKDGCICDRLAILEKQLHSLRKLSPFTGVAFVRKIIGYEKWIEEACGNDPSKKEDFFQILQWLSEEATQYRSLEDWLTFQKENGKIMAKTSGEGGVRLMTVHAAKGLEFDKVIMPDCNERVYPYGNLASESAVEEERRIFYVGMTRAKRKLILTYVAGSREVPRQPSRFLRNLIPLKS